MKAGYKISAEDARELREQIRITKNAVACRRMEAVALLGEGKTPDEVAVIKKYNSRYVRNLGREYHQKGLAAFGTDGRRGGNRRYMSFAEEEAFLEPFKAAAESGQIVEVSEIKKAYEEAIGRSLENSRGQIYFVLDRHKWRKIMPRSKHPNKASGAEIEALKN